jgi:hypothetical protein
VTSLTLRGRRLKTGVWRSLRNERPAGHVCTTAFLRQFLPIGARSFLRRGVVSGC